MVRKDAFLPYEPGDTVGQCLGLPGSGASQDKYRTVDNPDRPELFRVEVLFQWVHNTVIVQAESMPDKTRNPYVIGIPMRKNRFGGILDGISRLFERVERQSVTFGTWVVGLSCLIVLRILIESWISSFETVSAIDLFYRLSHFLLFLIMTVLLLVPVVRWAGKSDIPQAATLTLFGFLIVLTPPFVDAWITGGKLLWSFYKFDGLTGWSSGHGLPYRYLTLFGNRPDIGITYGVRFEVVVVTVFMTLLAFVRHKRLWQAFLAGLTTYSMLFVLGTLPSWLTIVTDGWRQGFLAISDVHVAERFLSPEAVFSQEPRDFSFTLNVKMSLMSALLLLVVIGAEIRAFFPKIFRALFRNSRIPQTFYHGGLLLTGIALSVVFTGKTVPVTLFGGAALLVLLGAVFCAWMASVVVNDLFDTKIDAKTNPHRPLPSGDIDRETYKTIGWLFFGASLILGGVANFKAIPYLFAYQVLAWVYSAPPFRLKRIPVLGTFIAATAGLVVLSLGFSLVSPDGSLHGLPARIIWFLLFTLTLVLSAKDFKDIEGDRADNVRTLPVILGESQAKMVIGGGTWIAYLASMYVFNEPRLFLPSLLFGSLSFWLVFSAPCDSKGWLHFRTLPGWLFIGAFLYGLFVMTSVF